LLSFVAIATMASACSGEIGSLSGAPRSDDPSTGLGFESGDAFPLEDPTCPSAAAVVSASDGWRSALASAAAFDTLEFELMARPEEANMDALVAVGDEDIADFSDAALVVRFADDGLIDVRDGDVYDKDLSFAYEAGVWYTVAILADVTTRTYDVEVSRCGESPRALITGAAFRDDTSVSDQLTTWAAWSSQKGKLELATPSWVASGSCAPATCESLGVQCGDPSDGCGGNLSCGGCDGTEACESGLCLPVGSPSPPDPPPSGGGPKPSPSSTGVVNAGALRSWPYGSRTITEPGVYENFTSTDGIVIEADNVTLRNCRITGGFYNVEVHGASSNVLIEDCELTDANNCALDYGDGTTFRRVWCHDQQSDAMKFAGDNTVLEYSLLEKIGMNGTTGHHDLVQATGCSNCEIRFSNLRGETCQSPPYHQSVAVIVESLPNEFVIRDSWLEGGSAPSIINGSSAASTRLSNNKFGTYYNSAVYSGGNFINDGGNVFECDNSPINTGNPPRPACAVPFPSSTCQ